MRAKQPPGRVARVCRYAAMVIISAAGFALVLFVRQAPGVTFTALPGARQADAAASARGGKVRGWQQSVSYVRPVLASSTITVVLDPQTASSEDMLNNFTALQIWTPIEAATADRTSIPARNEVIVYNVQAGDNLWLIAQRFGIDQDTVVWANGALEENPDLLKIGQELSILPVDGVWHTVQADETLAGIAAGYKVDPQKIIDYAPNGIGGDGTLQAGQKLIVPGGVKPPKPRPAAASQPKAAINGNRLIIPAGAPDVPVEAPAQPGRFIWPAQGIITQGYHKWHGAIDIANKLGTPLLAADAGTVTFAAVSGGLGNAVQIDHGDGFVTTYGHLDSIAVQVGQSLQKGEEIGKMGTTGHSTGPHLHLILLYNGGIINPMDYLPQ